CLRKYNQPSTVEDVMAFVAEDITLVERKALEEVNTYIASTSMPIYLQEDARKRALENINKEFVSELGTLLMRGKLTLQLSDVEEDADGCMKLSKAFVKARESIAIYTFTKEDEELLKHLETYCQEWTYLRYRVSLDSIAQNLVIGCADVSSMIPTIKYKQN
ncbi:MAG: hypothetical protein RR971_02905, partial [Alistipes sp.]